MKKCICVLLMVFSLAFAKDSPEDAIREAENKYKGNDLEQAIAIMKEAAKNHPDDCLAWSYLGYYQGMKAGAAAENNIAEAGRWLEYSFNSFDRAAKIDSTLPLFRLTRGVIFVNLPDFMNVMDQGISDLEYAEEKLNSDDDFMKSENAGTLYFLLGQSYLKKGDLDQCEKYWTRVLENFKGHPVLEGMAEKNLKKIQDKRKKTTSVPEKKREEMNLDRELKVFYSYLEANELDKADSLITVLYSDSKDISVIKGKLKLLEKMAGDGYDEKIHNDPNHRSQIAFDLMKVLDDAVMNYPDSLEFRSLRGMIGVEMPFFLKRLEQGMKDLEYVISRGSDERMINEAKFYLGRGHQKKGMAFWTEIIADNDSSAMADSVFFHTSSPVPVWDSEEIKKPRLEITFHLGFVDYIQPQTAVWLEDEKGNYLKTLYVSGFSKYVEDKQVVLPRWAKSSNFKNIDGVSCASIGAGKHFLVWDLNLSENKSYDKEKVTVCVEVCHWPTVKHEIKKTTVDLKHVDKKQVVTGKYIPYLKAEYVK